MTRYCSSKDINKLIDKMVRKGWQHRRRRKHGQIISPAGRVVTFSFSPSDCRAKRNLEMDIRHALNKDKMQE